MMSNEWFENGKLPLVDTRLEFNTGRLNNPWEPVTIIGYTKDKRPAFEYDNGTVSTISAQLIGCMSKYFRPIKSEREKAIDDMASIMGRGPNTYWASAEALYDAGYRKLEDK